MTDADFLRTIIERPDDDVPRLVMADWLDERGDQRGEFIRVQCELAGHKCERAHHFCGPSTKKEDDAQVFYHCEALRRRERELFQLAMNWVPVRGTATENVGVVDCLPDDRTCTSPHHGTYYFARGFPYQVACSWSWWSRHSAALLNAAPIRRVNRPRECRECEGKSGRCVPSWTEMRMDPWQECLTCRGTGRVDVWAGDGKVVLTTRPRVTDFGGDSGDVRYGLTRPVLTAAELGSVFAWHRMLDDAYPGVEFELPTARGDGPRDNRAILVDAAYRAIAADTQAGPTHDSPASAFFRTSLTPEARP